MDNIKNHMQQLLLALNRGVFEREEAIALSLLSAISGESIFLLGLPGVGKSMIARRLKEAFLQARSFEYLMSRFSTPDEIFGPVSITKLKDEDIYERVVDGYLPTADVVFLDEIWKAGPAIQNSLLTALNERIYHNGKQDLHLPLKTIISASNELPAEGEGLEALWDRFLVRYVVEPIQEKNAFLKLLTGHNEDCEVAEHLKIDDKMYKELQTASKAIEVPVMVCNILCEIRDALSDTSSPSSIMPGSETPPYISDRRWRKIVGILRTSALLNGRKEVDPSDCLLMEHLLWDNDSQHPAIRQLVADAVASEVCKNLPMGVSLEKLEGLSMTEPVGELYSPDGVHYSFQAGGEDLYIAREDYDKLSAEPVQGEIAADNVLHIYKSAGTLNVSKPSQGRIVINTLTYNLKRDSPLKGGSPTDLINNINKETDSLIQSVTVMINDNIFLRPSDTYTELFTAMNNKKLTRKQLRQR